MMRLALIAALALLTAGCVDTTFQGGRFASGTVAVRQSQNPKDPTTVTTERVTEVLTPGPTGTVITRTTEKTAAVLGAAQKNIMQEMGAKLKSLRPVMFVGIAVFLFGAASLVWPPLKAIVGSTTTSIIAAVAGIAMIALPTLIVGNEILILCVSIGGVVAWWFSHRHGELRGKVNSIEHR